MVTSQDLEEYSLRVEQLRLYLIISGNDEYLAQRGKGFNVLLRSTARKISP